MPTRTWVQRQIMIVAPVIVGGSLWALSVADWSFSNLWLTPDQQAQRLFDEKKYGEAANPSIRADAPLLDGSQQRLPTRSPWGARVVTSIVLAAAALCWRFRRLLTARLHVWRDHRSENEAAYFARVKTACQSHDPTMTYNALLRWLDRPHNGNDAVTVEQFVHRTADDELRDQVARLEWFAFGPVSIQHDAWSGLPLYTSLVRARKRAIQDNGRSSPNKHGALPPLNP